MNKLTTLLAAVTVALNTFAQTAPVPTSWDCNGTPPTGWEQVQTGTTGNLNYTQAALYTSAPSSARLDFTGEYVLIHVNDVPGLVTYNIKGSVGSGSWSGTFTTQWSADGTNWTNMRTYTTLPVLTDPFINAVDTPSSLARYIRFFYTTKASGSNVAIDDIVVNVPGAGPNQEVELTHFGSKLSTGSTIWFSAPVSSTTDTVKFKIFNLGSDSTLTISNAAVTGAAASDYTLGTVPASIAPLDSFEVKIAFSPSAAGTRVAKFVFNNNDSVENPFEINMNGIGGTLATEPATNPTAMTFTSVKSYAMIAGVTGNTSDGFLVLRKEGSAVTDAPVDGEVYDIGMGVGASKVFYVGNAANFDVREMVAGTDYHFAVFPYNGVAQYTNYKQTSPLAASRTSGAAAPGSYYNGIDTANNGFVTSLTTLINNHFQVFYSNYKSSMVDLFLTRDTVGDQKVVNCEYSGQFVQFTPPFDFAAQNMSREHCFASSWMPTFGTTGHEERYAYSDLHNLRLANQNDVNAPRSNDPFGEVTTQSGSYLLAKFGTGADGKKVFEPRDEIKGDVARGIMYMLTAYNNIGNKASSSSGQSPVTQAWTLNNLVIPGNFPNPDEQLSTRQKQALLRKWHQQDPPSAFERARNEFAFDQQDNRNPFIDNPDWACYIDFNTMTYVDNGCNGTVGINEVESKVEVMAYPNPATEKFSVSIISDVNYSATITLTDVAGKVVFIQDADVTIGDSNWFTVSLNDVMAGNYILTVAGNGSISKKVQVIK